MLRFILVDTTMFDSSDSDEQTRKDLCWWMEALTQRNQDYLRQRPNTPRLYKSGVRYQVPKQMEGECEEVHVMREALGKAARTPEVRSVLDLMQNVFGGERFRDIGRIIENGGGDCDNLACWRAAELRQYGIRARPYMTWRKRPGGGTIYHALVLWPAMAGIADESGQPQVTSEDPSLLLGMHQPERAADRAEEIRKNKERCDILRKRGGVKGAATAGVLESEIESVLGLRRPSKQAIDAAVAELDRIFGRVA